MPWFACPREFFFFDIWNKNLVPCSTRVVKFERFRDRCLLVLKLILVCFNEILWWLSPDSSTAIINKSTTRLGSVLSCVHPYANMTLWCSVSSTANHAILKALWQDITFIKLRKKYSDFWCYYSLWYKSLADASCNLIPISFWKYLNLIVNNTLFFSPTVCIHKKAILDVY